MTERIVSVAVKSKADVYVHVCEGFVWQQDIKFGQFLWKRNAL